jgi:ABC-2 type transport system permease protein
MIAEFAAQAGLAYAFVEREVALMKRYWLWELVWIIYGIVTSLSVAFIGIAAPAISGNAVDPATTSRFVLYLLVGTIAWRFMGLVFENIAEIIAWERWEGTIEYTFMAPLSRSMHLFGMGAFAVLYGLIRATILFFVVAAFIGIHIPDANYGAAFALLAIASFSFIGIGMMTSVLPLISPEKGAQLGFVMQGMMLVVSGVYYPVSVMPQWMQTVSKVSPATYALRGDRAAIVRGAGLAWADVWPLLVIAVVAIPLGLSIFKRGERYAKQHGKLKRSG